MAGKWMRKVRLRLHNRFSVQSIGRSVSHPICTSPQGRIRTANVEEGLTIRSTRSCSTRPHRWKNKGQVTAHQSGLLQRENTSNSSSNRVFLAA